ncbi:MAG: glycerophosphodiester phosphodiesterase family protein, partial [Planctomycetia bacterium]|nr:glycerophosphodiester phosphodiesterase family protein [Planctomycetia bacterium]
MLKRCVFCLVVFFAASLLVSISAEAKLTNHRPFLRFRCARAGSPLEFRGMNDLSTGDSSNMVQDQETIIAEENVSESDKKASAAEAIVLPSRGVCAHRGETVVFPENTVSAFREAARLGAHQIEFDVCVTKDGKLVVMHDLSVDRTTNGTGRIADLTFDEIRRLDAGIKKGEQFKGTKVPTLEEALDVMPR